MDAGFTSAVHQGRRGHPESSNDIEPYRYLVALFKKLPLAQTVDDYEALLPWNIELGGT